MLTDSNPLHKRQQERYELNCGDLELTLHRTSADTAAAITAIPLDVSPNGLKISTSTSLGFGERIELQFDGLGTAKTSIEAEVRWIRQREGEQEWICGCSILTVNPVSWLDEMAEAGLVDRRKSSRTKTNASVTVHIPGMVQSIPASLLDYSNDGVSIASATAIEADRPLIIEIEQPGGEAIRLRARSIWQMKFETGYMAGCQLSPDHRESDIAQWVESARRSDTHILENKRETKILDHDNDTEEIVLDEELPFEEESLIDALDELESHVEEVFAESEEQPSIPSAELPVVDEAHGDEPDSESPQSKTAVIEPDYDPISIEPDWNLEPEPELNPDAETQVLPAYEPTPQPVEPKSKVTPSPKRFSIGKAICLVVVIELILAAYFGTFYWNWDRTQVSSEASARPVYHHLQGPSEVVFYPAEQFEALISGQD